MTRRVAASLLILLGAWWLASYLSFWITVALIPINNRLIYEGDAGVILMRFWMALPLATAAAMASPVVLTLTDVRRKDVLLAILTALMLYSGFSRVHHEWTTLRETIDRIGTVIQGVTPALACAAVGVYWLRRAQRRLEQDGSS